MAKLVECFVCGKKHEYCPTCGQTHGWKFFACDYEHYQIYQIILHYDNRDYTAEESVEALAHLGYTAESDMSDLFPVVECKLRQIISEAEQEKSAKTSTKSTEKTAKKSKTIE